MKIERFGEAYKYGYHGKGFKSNRRQAIDEITDLFSEGDILGFEITGTEFHPNEEILYLYLDRTDGRQFKNEDYCLKLDLSGMGIEIGKKPWNKAKDEPGNFIPEINLDSKQVAAIRDIEKYNV
jgi:hypothetical protein